MNNTQDERATTARYLKETTAELEFAKGNSRRTELLTAEMLRLQAILNRGPSGKPRR
jgi:hypothetical protein